MTILAINPTVAFANAKDDAAIKTIIESVGTLADTGNFEALEKLYAPEVELDYTSLTGGEVELKSPQAIMTQWASTLPGFDRTRHQIDNIQVSSNGGTATATAEVIADHYVDDLFWQVTGDYRYELVNDDGWKIKAHQFRLREEQGTRDVFGPAVRNAQASPPDYIKRQQTRDAVLSFLTSLESKDMARFASVLDDDMVQDMPYSPDGHPKRVSGKANILELFANWPKVSKNADFTSQLVFYPMQSAEMVFVEYTGDVDIIPTGRKYRQSYGGLFHVVEGKIKLFREYYDPEPFKYAFALDDIEG